LLGILDGMELKGQEKDERADAINREFDFKRRCVEL
jgi:hypothetical protein